MRHRSFPFSTLWLFISFSILIINWANLQPVLFFFQFIVISDTQLIVSVPITKELLCFFSALCLTHFNDVEFCTCPLCQTSLPAGGHLSLQLPSFCCSASRAMDRRLSSFQSNSMSLVEVRKKKTKKTKRNHTIGSKGRQGNRDF